MRKFTALMLTATVATVALANENRFLAADINDEIDFEAWDSKAAVKVDFGAALLSDLITSYQTPLLSPTQVGGKWTIGYSYVDKINKKSANITEEQAKDLLGSEIDDKGVKKNGKVNCVLNKIKWVEPKVNKKTNTTTFTQNNLTPNQYSALIAFVYDVGCPQFLKIATPIVKTMKNQTANINDSIQSIIGSIGNSTRRGIEIAHFINAEANNGGK